MYLMIGGTKSSLYSVGVNVHLVTFSTEPNYPQLKLHTRMSHAWHIGTVPAHVCVS